jgi:hypothetical protein
MDWTLIYGLLIATGLFALAWFAFVIPSQRRDHERRLALIQKRLAEREKRLREGGSNPHDDNASYGDQK